MQENLIPPWPSQAAFSSTWRMRGERYKREEKIRRFNRMEWGANQGKEAGNWTLPTLHPRPSLAFPLQGTRNSFTHHPQNPPPGYGCIPSLFIPNPSIQPPPNFTVGANLLCATQDSNAVISPRTQLMWQYLLSPMHSLVTFLSHMSQRKKVQMNPHLLLTPANLNSNGQGPSPSCQPPPPPRPSAQEPVS